MRGRHSELGAHADVDQGPSGDSRRGRGARAHRRGNAHRRLRGARRDARAGRRRFRRLAPCRAARPRQCASPFLPDADPRPPVGDQQGAFSLARRALSDLGAAEAEPPPPRGASRPDRTSALGLHDGGGPPLSLSGRARECGRHRGRGGAQPRHAHDRVARLDESLQSRTAACRPTASCRTRTRFSPTANGC